MLENKKSIPGELKRIEEFKKKYSNGSLNAYFSILCERNIIQIFGSLSLFWDSLAKIYNKEYVSRLKNKYFRNTLLYQSVKNVDQESLLQELIRKLGL